jgi:hypothetical protein
MIKETGHVDFDGDGLILEVLQVFIRRFLGGEGGEGGREGELDE